jgi:hypothetical protein
MMTPILACSEGILGPEEINLPEKIIGIGIPLKM